MKKFLSLIICFFVGILNVGALELNLYSNNAVIYNYDLDQVIYEKNADEVVSVASMTKIMSAIVLIENIDNLDTTVVLNNNHFKGLIEKQASLAGFYVGEKVTYRDLIYGILLPSGAEAVQTLAIEVFGSNDKLVEKMNEKALELNLTNTHFVNPFGLDDDGHYSTVKEISTILKYALKNDFFKEVYETRKYLTSDTKITLYSTIVSPLKAINNNATFIKGSKTGFTYDAGRCLASIAYDENNDINYLMVTAKAKNVVTYPVLDAINAYEKVFSSFTKKSLYKSGDTVATVKTKYAKEKNVDIVVHEDIELFYEIDNFDESKLTYKVDAPKKITKLLSSSQKIGTLHVYYDGDEIKTATLFLKNDMHFSFLRFFTNIVLPFGLLALIVVIALKIPKIIRK